MTKEYIVIGRSNGTTKMGSPYCNLKIKNEEEEVSLAVWEVQPDDAPVTGQLVSFEYIQNNEGKRAARKSDMYPGKIADSQHPLYHLIPHAIERTEWDRCIAQLCVLCGDSPHKEMIGEVADKLYQPYSQYPAATCIHHAFRGGLLNHTYQILHMLEGLAPCLPYPVRLDHCVIAALFHDYGKIRVYNRNGEQQPENALLGHIYISANALQRELERRNIEQKELERIIHIVLAHHGQLDYGSPVMPCTQEAAIIHLLDNLSAKTDTIENSGDMEYVNSLNTRVVK